MATAGWELPLFKCGSSDYDLVAGLARTSVQADATGGPVSPAIAAARASLKDDSPSKRLSKQSMRSATVNKNVEWVSSKGAWAFYIGLLVLGWLAISVFVDSGLAWTIVHLLHGVATFWLLHWNKGSPIESDQGRYDQHTFWEQLDSGVQNTGNRKFFMVVPVVLFLLATHLTDYRRQPLGLNLAVLLVLLIAKTPAMHKVRIFGINKY